MTAEFVTMRDDMYHDISYDSLRMAKISHKSGLPILKSESHRRQLIDELLQSYIDFSIDSGQWNEEAKEYVDSINMYLRDDLELKDRGPYEKVARDKRTRELFRIAHIMIHNKNSELLDKPSVSLKTIQRQQEKETRSVTVETPEIPSDIAHSLDELIIGLNHQGALDDAEAKGLLVALRLRGNNHLTDKQRHLVSDLLGLCYGDFKSRLTNEPMILRGKSKQYKNPRIEDGMQVIYALMHFAKLPEAKGGHPFSAYITNARRQNQDLTPQGEQMRAYHAVHQLLMQIYTK